MDGQEASANAAPAASEAAEAAEDLHVEVEERGLLPVAVEKDSGGECAPHAARIRELHDEVAQIGFRRGRLACACEHGVVMGSRRLLALILTVSWRRLIAACQVPQQADRGMLVEEVGRYG